MTIRPSSQIVLPALLLVGIAAATAGFVRTRAVQARRRGEESVPATAAQAPAVANAGNAASVFQRRVESLEARLAAAPSDRDALLELARLLHDGHRTAAAVPLYRRALALTPDDAAVVYDLASAHGELGEWDAAADVLTARLADQPGDAVALYDLGAVRANQGRAEEARRHLEAAREVATDGALLARISEALARLKAS